MPANPALPLLACAAAIAAVVPAVAAAPLTRTAEIRGPANTDLGALTVTDAPNGVLLRIEANGLTPGWHAAHFHEKADCSDAEFKKSGGHVHTAKTLVHGLLNPLANDDGDLPNIYVGKDGTATVELYSTLVSLTGAGQRPALADADGSALVIHANPDDYSTQPIGGAGPRVACAAIK